MKLEVFLVSFAFVQAEEVQVAGKVKLLATAIVALSYVRKFSGKFFSIRRSDVQRTISPEMVTASFGYDYILRLLS
nr:Mitochondrial import receptor subunit TOM40-like protein 1 [Ipomoea batatas]